jgi:hypothetical protein
MGRAEERAGATDSYPDPEMRIGQKMYNYSLTIGFESVADTLK